MEIQGFPDYVIYPDGRVWSNKSNKFMTPCIRSGYLYVPLRNNGRVKNKLVHRLIAEHYIPNPENKPTIDHMNRNRVDNRIENLRWATRVEQNSNQGKRKRNKSGHTYISWNKSYKGWRFLKQGAGEGADKYFKSKTDALCYKYIYLLKIKTKK